MKGVYSMKRYTAILSVLLLMAQVACCPFALAEESTTASTDATGEEGVTTAMTAESTDASADTLTTATTVITESITSATATEQSMGTDTTSTLTEITIETTTNATESTVHTGGTTEANDGVISVGTQLIIYNKDGKVAARLLDANGNPLMNVPVALQLGSTKLNGEFTNADGYALFSYAYPSEGTYIYCSTEAFLYGNILYAAAAASVGVSPVATTTADDVSVGNTTYFYGTTTYRTYYTGTTAPTVSTKAHTKYTAPGTTGVKESYVLLDFAFDSGVLESFNAEQQTFADVAKLMLAPEAYAQMIGTQNGVLMMSAATSALMVTDEQITASVKDDTVLSRVNPADVKRLVLDMSVQFKDAATGTISDVWTIPEGTYAVQMPVPQSMRSAQYITIAAVTAEGISAPVYATVSDDGTMLFESTSPVGTIVILGFEGSALGTFREYSTRIALVFLVIGLVCVGGAIFLYFRFVRRPKVSKKKADEEQVGSTSAEDAMLITAMDDEFEEFRQSAELDVFDESNPKPLQPIQEPDIDIPL